MLSIVGNRRGFIPLIFVVVLLATLIPNPALAGEGSVTRNYSTASAGSFFWTCNHPVSAPTIRQDIGGACFALTGHEKTPASITIRDAAGLPGFFEYRTLYRAGGGWVGLDYGGACGTSVSIDSLPPHDPARQVYLQVQLQHSLGGATFCPKGTYTAGTVTFSFTT